MLSGIIQNDKLLRKLSISQQKTDKISLTLFFVKKKITLQIFQEPFNNIIFNYLV